MKKSSNNKRNTGKKKSEFAHINSSKLKQWGSTAFYIILVILILINIQVIYSCNNLIEKASNTDLAQKTDLVKKKVASEKKNEKILNKLAKGETIYSALRKNGLHASVVHEIVSKIENHFNFKNARVGDRMILTLDKNGKFKTFEFKPRGNTVYRVDYIDGRYVSHMMKKTETK